MVGNIIAGKTLAKNANATIIATLLGMMLLYVFIFICAKQKLTLFIFVVLLGILVSIVNNAVHYVITHLYPQALDFTNELFVSSENIGISTDVALCHFSTIILNLNSTQKNALSNFKKFVSFRNKISFYLSLIVLIYYYIFISGVGLTPEILGYKLGPSAITLGIMAGWLDRALHYLHRNLYLHRQLFFRQRARRNA